ncbi:MULTISPECIES: phage tail fiber protein [Burkholderia]|uniref:phage tail fiber domain-containing protein n=1 Tax=Burkholderia TaxID=32008 RepID=UPI000B7A9F48|nr:MULTISPECIES: phage tail fiber protein [Burkholderia]MBY4728631.1 hypothetical protein [Burkholderia contaminans]MCI3969236.1 phage tail fiber protein [Burkholderia sp. HI4860]OXI98469.1 hypothetical protein CFB48_24020 [Burkholderia sp. AU33647]
MLSRAIYSGDGTTKVFAVPFPYIDKSHVTVRVNKIEVLFTWINSSSVLIPEPPVAGLDNVEVRRTTPSDPHMVVFQDASTLTAPDLNLESTQLLYLAQERQDEAGLTLMRGPGRVYDAGGLRITDVSYPQADGDAATLGSVKQITETLLAGVEGGYGSFIASGAGAVVRTFQDKQRDSVGVKDYAAPQQAVDASGGSPVVLPTGTSVVVTSLSNPLGSQFVGGGAILKPASQGGLVQINSYGDDGKVFVGKEYLYRLYLRIKQGGMLKGFIYGDSTAATAANGGGYAGPNFEPQVLIPEFLVRAKGIRNNMSFTNRGVGGTRVAQMNAIPDIDQVGGTTDIFFIKYGINDAQDGISGFASNLRSKLAEIRSNPYGTVQNLSIVLVGPTATYDPQHGRASPWYERLRGIYLSAARDYQCAYFDSYAYMRDISWAAGYMMSDDFGNGQGVHPTELMQTQVWGGLIDAMMGESDITPYVSDEWRSLTMLDGWSPYVGGGGFASPGASMSRDGWVSLRGLVTGGTVSSGTSIAQLPAGMWPYVIEMFECTTASGRCSLRVNTNGNIEQQDGYANATFTSLSGIRFKARG